MIRVVTTFAVAFALVLTLAFGTQAANADPITPFDFNVYSLGDIGTSSSGYGSDFEGTAAAAGSAYFQNFSLNLLNQPKAVPGFSLVTGGNAAIAGQINNGGIQAGGNVSINNSAVFGNVYSGGNLYGPGGTVHGNATLGGNNFASPSVTINGAVTEGASFYSSVDFNSMNQYVTNFANGIKAQSDNTSYDNQYGNLVINAASGDNYVTIDGATLNSAWGVTINGEADSVVYINVDGTNVSLDSTNWVYNGLLADDVLLNFGDATDLALTGGNNVNLLAAFADVYFAHGLITGNLIAGNLTGSGQVNLGGYTPSAVPEPSSALALLLGSGAMFITRRRRKRAA